MNFLPRHSYATLKELFEVSTFWCFDPVGYITITDSDTNLYTKAALRRKHKYLQYLSDDGQRRSFIHRWLMDDRKRFVGSFDVDVPSLYKASDLWIGFHMQRIPRFFIHLGSAYPFIARLENMTCQNMQHAAYLTKWLAQMIQDPGNITGVGMIIVGSSFRNKEFFEFFSTIINRDRFLSLDDSLKMMGPNLKKKRVGKILISTDFPAHPKDNYGYFRRIIDWPQISGGWPQSMSDIPKNTNRVVVCTDTDPPPMSPWWEMGKVYSGADDFDFGEYFQNTQNQLCVFDYLQGIAIQGTNWSSERPNIRR